MLKKILPLLTLVFSIVAFAQNQPVFSNPTEKIIVSQSDPQFTIRMQSNPTTGYSWKLVGYDTGLIRFVSHQFVAPKNKRLVGAPGYEEWVFAAKKAHYRVAQVGHIGFEYKRPWEKQAVKKVNFMVVVKR